MVHLPGKTNVVVLEKAVNRMLSVDELNQKVMADIASLQRSLAEVKNNTLYGAGDFWIPFCEKHQDMIREYGFETFKRTINFHYRQWWIHSLRDKQIWLLIWYILKRGRLPIGAFSPCLAGNWSISDKRTKIGVDRLPNRLPYTLYTKLLWKYALMEDQLGCLKTCDEPILGSPLPIMYRGKLISQDLAISSLELNRMGRLIDFSRIGRVAEIGAGYGRLTYLMVHRFPQIVYSIFDIPPTLAVAQNYLTYTLGAERMAPFQEDGFEKSWLLSPEAQVGCFLPHQLEEVPDGHFDLLINISSFDEMTRAQVSNYFSLIDKKCRGWVYLKGNARVPSDEGRMGVEEFPYPSNWECLYSGTDPVVSSWAERVYRLRP